MWRYPILLTVTDFSIIVFPDHISILHWPCAILRPSSGRYHLVVQRAEKHLNLTSSTTAQNPSARGSRNPRTGSSSLLFFIPRHAAGRGALDATFLRRVPSSRSTIGTS